MDARFVIVLLVIGAASAGQNWDGLRGDFDYKYSKLKIRYI